MAISSFLEATDGASPAFGPQDLSVVDAEPIRNQKEAG